MFQRFKAKGKDKRLKSLMLTNKKSEEHFSLQEKSEKNPKTILANSMIPSMILR
jgi:hypothetical protein